MAPPPTPSSRPPPLTLGESLAQSSRCNMWTGAVFSQILCLSFALALAYYAYKSEISPSPWSSVPWLLALLMSLGASRTPVAVVDKIHNIGMWGVGVLVIGGMASAVLGLQVRDTRVLAVCTGVAHAFIVCVVGFWVWLVRAYGGHSGDNGDALDGV